MTSVVSTSKDAQLVGCKLLLTKRIDERGEYVSLPEIAIDTVGAGNGETVIITTGSSARLVTGRTDAPIDATIVGIVDAVKIDMA